MKAEYRKQSNIMLAAVHRAERAYVRNAQTTARGEGVVVRMCECNVKSQLLFLEPG